MTTYAENTSRTSAGWPMFAALGAGVALVLAAVGTFWDATGNDTASQGMKEYLPVVAIVVVATALVFGLVVRTAGQGNAGRRALILAVLGVLSLVVFWSGLPPVLALGAIGCAMATPGGPSTAGKVSIGLGGVTLVLAVVAAVMG